MELIKGTEIIPDPVLEVDTELEEAKKLIGTWVFIRDLRKAAFIVEDVERNRDKNIILRANDNWHYSHEVTSAPFLTTLNGLSVISKCLLEAKEIMEAYERD